MSSNSEYEQRRLFEPIGLSREMINNCWVTETDEFGNKMTYNKKFVERYLSESQSDGPKFNLTMRLVDFCK